jgi:hypothetical protein
MEHRASHTPDGLGRWPLIFGIGTVLAFGGSMLLVNFKPWGLWLAAVMLGGWAVMALLSSHAQDRLDRAAGGVLDRARQVRSKLTRALQAPLFLGAIVSFGYAQWLTAQGAPDGVSKPYADGAMFLSALGWIVALAVEPVARWWSNRQPLKDAA